MRAHNYSHGEDLIFGRQAIAKMIGDDMTAEGVTWLHKMGRLPVIRIGSSYIANRRSLEAAIADGIRRRRPKSTWKPLAKLRTQKPRSRKSQAPVEAETVAQDQ
jgi:hypothetical protein